MKEYTLEEVRAAAKQIQDRQIQQEEERKLFTARMYTLNEYCLTVTLELHPEFAHDALTHAEEARILRNRILAMEKD